MTYKIKYNNKKTFIILLLSLSLLYLFFLFFFLLVNGILKIHDEANLKFHEYKLDLRNTLNNKTKRERERERESERVRESEYLKESISE